MDSVPRANGDSMRNLQRHVADNESNRASRQTSRSLSKSHPLESVRGAARKTTRKSTRFMKGTVKQSNKDADGLLAIMKHPFNIFLLFLPAGIASAHLEWPAVWTFWLNFAALVPLAKILGDATEELANSLKNDMLAGLLNATFGNTVEVVITVQSLRAGLIRVVKTTLLGSVLSNTLLVLGTSFYAGGLLSIDGKAPEKQAAEYGALEEDDDSPVRIQSFGANYQERIQSFSLLGALVNTSMLLVSCLCFSLITIFDSVLLEEDRWCVLPVSRQCSLLIMTAYIASIFFQLVTHKEAMAEQEDDEQDAESMSTWISLFMLLVTTVVTAYSSELLVDSIKGTLDSANLTEHFIGIILLPIVGNACEHAAAVRFAVQDKLGLSVSIAVGSSTQIALFVVPLSVVIGWVMDVPMDLNFGVFNCSLITLSVIVVLSMVVDGQSNWLQGYLLLTIYAIISAMYWKLPDDVHDGRDMM